MKRIHSNDLKNIKTVDETIWTSKSFVFLVNEEGSVFQSDNVKFCDYIPKPSQNLVTAEKYKNLIHLKNQIEEVPMNKRQEWNKWVHLLNPYEKIGSFSNIDQSITVTRAFYKLYELMIYYNIRVPEGEITFHMCEAPGGFIGAMRYLQSNITWYAHTLYVGPDSLKIDDSINIPGRWIGYGRHDGNLYNLDNILEIAKELPRKVYLLTGDGGFDVSYDANSQEQLSFKLIYAQFLTALHVQAIGGIFILKIFDTFTRPTCQLLYIIRKYYDNVEVIKPRTSRSSNSEKYVVARGFRGIGREELGEFSALMDMWVMGQYCKSLGMDFPESIERLREYNDFLSVNQSWYIHKSICCIKYYDRTKQHTTQFNPHNLEALQNKRALEFCMAFGLRQLDSKKCSHSRVTIIKHETIEGVAKCNKCMKLIIQ